MSIKDSKNAWLIFWLFAIAWLLYLLSPILTPFLIAALLAYLGDPLVDRLELRKLPRTLAVSLVFVVIVAVLLILALILIPRIESQIVQLIEKLPVYLDWARERVQLLAPADVQLPDSAALKASLHDYIGQAGGVLAYLWASLTKSSMALLAWLANLVLIPVLTFYLLRDWDHLVEGARSLLPRNSAKVWIGLMQESDIVLGAFLRGQLLVMFALGIIYTTGLWFVGLDFALLIGMLAGIVSFVPYLGLIVGILVAGVSAVLQFHGYAELPWVILVFVVGQLLEGSVLTPRLVGERIGLHPVAVMFAVMAGAQLYGFFGILLALPVAAIAMVLLRHLLGTYRSSTLYHGKT